MESLLAYLQMIQSVISRMAGNSFLIKGWTLALIAAIFALSIDGGHPDFAVVALLPAVGFWLLDSYYLRQERLFRALYDDARARGNDGADFSMSTAPFEGAVQGLFRTALSKTEAGFHGPIVAVILLLAFGLNGGTFPTPWHDQPSSASTINETSGGSTKSETPPMSPDAQQPDSKTPPSGKKLNEKETPPLRR